MILNRCLELPKNVGEPVGNHRWAVSGRITDSSDVVSLLCTGVYLTLAHIKDGEGLTVDDFRFDDLDFHFLFPFLFFVFLSIADFSDLSILNKCFFSATPILVNHFAVFATAWADFVIELLATHLLAAALGEGQDFVDFVLHFLFPFLFFPYFLYRHYTD